MVGMGLEINQVGIGPAHLEHLVGGGGQGGDVGVDDLNRSARADRESFQPCGGVVPDQFLRRDVKAIEFHEVWFPGSDQTSSARLQLAAAVARHKHFGVFGGLVVGQDNCSLQAARKERELTGSTGN